MNSYGSIKHEEEEDEEEEEKKVGTKPSEKIDFWNFKESDPEVQNAKLLEKYALMSGAQKDSYDVFN